MKEFEKIVNLLENGDLTLDESLEYFKNGVTISNELVKKLDSIEKEITTIIDGDKANLE